MAESTRSRSKRRNLPLTQLRAAATEESTVPTAVVDHENANASHHQEVTCTLAGLDSVQCVVTDEFGAPASSTLSRAGIPLMDTTSSSDLPSVVMQAALLVSPFFFWGTSMCVMKGVLTHTTPLMLGAMRLLPAGLALVAWADRAGRAQPQGRAAWGWVAAFAIVDAAAFQGFLAEGLQRTSAGLGSVIIDSQPLTVAVLAALLFNETLGVPGVFGLLLGVLGLGLLEVPEPMLRTWADQVGDAAGGLLVPGSEATVDIATAASHLGSAMEPGLAAAAVAAASAPSPSLLSTLGDSGEWWMLCAAQSMAVGTIMVRYVSRHVDPVMATGWHMVLGGAVLAVASLLHEGPAELVTKFSQFTGEDAAAMAYVSLLGGAAGYGIFFYNASRGSLTALSSLTFLTPVFAAATGYLTLGETLTPLQTAGGVVTLAAVTLINRK